MRSLNLSLKVAKHDIWTSFVLNLVNWTQAFSRWLLPQKWDFSIYGYKLDKWEGWTSNSMSLDAKYDFSSSLFGFRKTESMRMSLNDPQTKNDLNLV